MIRHLTAQLTLAEKMPIYRVKFRRQAKCHGIADSEFPLDRQNLRFSRRPFRRLAALGVAFDQGAISRVESEERYLMDYELLAIAKALKIKPSSLLD